MVEAAAEAAFAQDQRCTAPLMSTNPVAPPSLQGAHASVPTVVAHSQDHSVAGNQAAAAAVTCTELGNPVETPSNTAAEAAPAEAAAAESGAQAHALPSGSHALVTGNKQDLSDVQAHAHSSDSAAPSSAQQAGSRAPSKATVDPAAAELKHAADTEAHALDRTPASAVGPVGVAPSCEADQPASAKASKKRKKSQSQPINNVFGSVSRNRKRAKAKKQKSDSLAAAAAAGAAAAVGGASSAHCPLGTEDGSESTIPNSSAAASNDTNMASAEAEVGSPDRSRHSQRPATGSANDKSSRQDHAQQQRSRIPSTAKAAMHTSAAAAIGGGQHSLDSHQQGSGSDRGNAIPGSLPDGDQPMGGGAGQGNDAPGPADFQPEHDSDDEVCA